MSIITTVCLSNITILVNVYGSTLQDDFGQHFLVAKGQSDFSFMPKQWHVIRYWSLILVHTWNSSQIYRSHIDEPSSFIFHIEITRFWFTRPITYLMRNYQSFNAYTKDLKTKSLCGALIHHHRKPYTSCLSKLISTTLSRHFTATNYLCHKSHLHWVIRNLVFVLF